MIDNDPELQERFRTLRKADAVSAPGFPAESDRPRGRWLLNRGAVALAVLLISFGVISPLIFNPRNSGADREDHFSHSEVNYGDLSRLISRQVFAASAGSWESPTDFLLNSDQLTEPLN